MSIPKNITKDHLMAAIGKIDIEGIPTDGDSRYYDVVYNGKKYPPKLLVSYANLFANGQILDRNSFEGGVDTPCFKLLQQYGFKVEEKKHDTQGSYFEELQKFLLQANSNELKTSEYLKNFLGLKVKVSFGQGNQSRVPWIAFLNDVDTVQQGIYPVYLYYKEKQLLILAYGISETYQSNRDWDLTNYKTIDEYFDENGLGKPERYGSSYVYKAYDVIKGLNQEMANADLTAIINVYKNSNSQHTNPNPLKKFEYHIFIQNAYNSGFFFSKSAILRFVAALLTKPFVILTGLSGSGKTKLAQAFAMWICENRNQYCIVPVGADWTNREPLLGFPNALKENEYVKPDNRVLDIIINANKFPDKPHFLILDEMNLSHVERYFADFLSVMESKNPISLHSGFQDWNQVPAEIRLPKNLFIIGTVNIDETTYMFSPKVLDRASVIEFRVTSAEMATYLKNNKPTDLEGLRAHGSSMAESFIKIAETEVSEMISPDELNHTLVSFFSELKKVGAEFGFRSASEMIRFSVLLNKIDSSWRPSDIIDACVMQKLLPKVHGSRRKLEPVLKTLGSLCLANDQKIDDYLAAKAEINFTDTSKIKYPVSLEKILRMYTNLISNGFTSYAEA